MAIILQALLFILICYLIILLPVLFRYIKNRRQQKKELKRPPPTSIIVEAPYSLPPNLSPLNYTSYTHSLGFDGHPMESDSSSGIVSHHMEIVRGTSNHEISDEQTMQKETRRLLKDIQGKANKDPVKLKTRFELLKE